MNTYYWSTPESPHRDNMETMSDYLNYHMPDSWHIILTDGTYAEIVTNDDIYYAVHASGNGDCMNHKVEFEYLSGELYTFKQLNKLLVVGAKIKIGKVHEKHFGLAAGTIIELVNGTFDYDNGLYEECHEAPSRWNEKDKDFDSIYHMFGNDLGEFYDCEILDLDGDGEDKS